MSELVAGIASAGLATCERFLDDAAVEGLLAEAEAAHADGRLRHAAVGGSRRIDPAIRGDSTCWLDPADAGAAVRAYFAAMDALREGVNRELMLGAFEIEAHYALFAPGTSYARHLDRPRSSEARVLSTVLYLNPDWRERDGGALRVFLPGGGAQEILPRAGVLVAFLSDAFEHEVLPAARERWSIAGWLRRRGASGG